MPQLIKEVTGEVVQEIIGSTSLFTPIVGELQQGDYINLNGYIAYTQELEYATCNENILKPTSFGLKNNSGAITLNIDY